MFSLTSFHLQVKFILMGGSSHFLLDHEFVTFLTVEACE